MNSNGTIERNSLRNIAVTVLASGIVAMVTAIVMQGRALVAVQVKDSAQDEKLEALFRRIDAMQARIDQLQDKRENER
jgi:hypothetical protein